MKRCPTTIFALAATIVTGAIALTACGTKNGKQIIGSADGATGITVTDSQNAASAGIIGGADGPTAIYIDGKDKGDDRDQEGDTAATERLLAERGLALIDRMSRLARSEEYVSYMTGTESMLDEIAAIASADYTSPQQIMIIDGTAFAPDTTDFIRNQIRVKAVRSVPAMINGLNGAQILAASSILQVDDAFRCDGIDHTAIYLFAYDAPYSAMVTYNPTEDGTVAAIASFVKFSPADSAAVSRHVADAIGSIIESRDITVRNIDMP